MNSRERLTAALEHREPDRVPYDLAGCHVTGIHQTAYRNLCRHYGLDDAPAPFADSIQQIVQPGEALLERMRVDTRGLFPLTSHNWHVPEATGEIDMEFQDEWGFVHRFTRNGFWWSLVKSPLDGLDFNPDELRDYRRPQAGLPERIAGLREQAERYRAAGHVVMLKGLCAGPFEMGQRLRGMENFLCDVMTEPEAAGSVVDVFTDLKIQFWEMALDHLGPVVDVVVEADDYGTQVSQLMPPETFRKLMKPRLNRLFSFIKSRLRQAKPAGERGWLFFHSCGNIRPILPDLIEMGVDILNPVHVSAVGMEPVALKKDFGSDVTFWGGGVDTQEVLPGGTPAQVRDNVRRNLEALMPGGGYVFNTVHNIQAGVPAENIAAMREALDEFGNYRVG